MFFETRRHWALTVAAASGPIPSASSWRTRPSSSRGSPHSRASACGPCDMSALAPRAEFAAHRGTTAAATTSASVRRSMSCIQEQRQKECVQMPGEMARSDPRPSARVTRGAGSGRHLASVLQEGRENANIDAALGFIWGISVNGPIGNYGASAQFKRV